MKKIIEYIISDEDLDLWGAGVDILSLVQNPAIQLDFLAFTQPGLGTSELDPYVDETWTPEQREIFLLCKEMGTTLGPDDVLISQEKSSFSTLSDFLKGLTAIDILGRSGVSQDDPVGETVWRYAGPPAQRGFCKAMQRLNRVYRRDEIELLNSAQPGMGAGGSDTYSIWNWKGGVNCRHYWEQLQMFKSDGRTVFVSEGPARGVAGETNNASEPSSAGAVANNASLKFSLEDDEQVVVGPAMIPNKLIKRIDPQTRAPYWVYFSADTIRDISEKWFKIGAQNQTNIEHTEGTLTTENTLLESWIVEDPLADKSTLYGFSVPAGTWMVKYRINDPQTWKKIKEGILRGFSVEGYFVDRMQVESNSDKILMDQIIDILKQVE